MSSDNSNTAGTSTGSLLKRMVLLAVMLEFAVLLAMALWLVCLRLMLAGMMYRTATWAAGGLLAVVAALVAWRLFRIAKRRRLQFSLRALLLFTAALSLLLSLAVPYLKQLRDRQAVYHADRLVSRLDGTVTTMRLSDAADNAPLHLMDRRHSLGVSFRQIKLTEDDLNQLSGLTPLCNLHLEDVQLDDQGLLHLQRLPYLVALWFRDTEVSPSVVKQFASARPDCDLIFVFEKIEVSPSTFDELRRAGPNCSVFRSEMEMREWLLARNQETIRKWATTEEKSRP